MSEETRPNTDPVSADAGARAEGSATAEQPRRQARRARCPKTR